MRRKSTESVLGAGSRSRVFLLRLRLWLFPACRGIALVCSLLSRELRRAVEKTLIEARRDGSSIVVWRGCVVNVKEVGCWWFRSDRAVWVFYHE